jgi:hypothetical protein
VSVEHSGPMADLWPAVWNADGQGSIIVPTLEAGWHTIRVTGKLRPMRVKIPALPAAPVTLSVAIQQRNAKPSETPDPDTAMTVDMCAFNTIVSLMSAHPALNE